MRFDLVDLRLFSNVAQSASITEGAARSNMALSSASARIRGMEKTLGAALLDRNRRGVTLTPAGRALARHAQVILQQIEHMNGELGDFAQGVKGHVKLMANSSALSEFLPETLADFLTAHPNIDIDVEERPSYEMVDAISHGLADAAIVSDAVDHGDLETFPFGADPLAIVVPDGHRLAGRQTVAFRTILDEDLVGLAHSSALQQYLDHQAVQLGRRLELRVRVNGFEAVGRIVERGVGIGIVPESAAIRCRKTMALHVVPLSDKWARRQLLICVRRLRDLPPHAQRLIDHLSVKAGHAPPALSAGTRV